MKNTLKRLVKSRKVLVTIPALLIAMVMTVTSIAAPAVRIEAAMGVANATAGETTYSESTNAGFDEVVQVQLWYHNMENADSGLVAENLNVKFDVPTEKGATQVIKGTVGGDNTNNVVMTSTVNLSRDDARLEYIPGSAKWRHNAGDNTNIDYQTVSIGDEVVTSPTGLDIENAQPCFNFEATVTIQLRVIVDSVKIDKYVKVEGSDQDWAREVTAQPGDTLAYKVEYRNAGNSWQNGVVIRDSMPPRLNYVPGSTWLINQTNPGGVNYSSDNLTNGGIVIGDYGPNANAFVYYNVTIPEADGLLCGTTKFRNVAVARPANMNEFYNTADVHVDSGRECEEEQPVYSCDMLTADKNAISIGDTVTYTVKATAQNGASVTGYTVDFGDGQTADIDSTDTTATVQHTYSEAGAKTVNATAHFDVNGQPQSDSQGCATSVDVQDEPEAPYCKIVEATMIDRTKVRVTVATSDDSAINTISYDFGDGSDKVVTTDKTVEYTYTTDGQKNITVVVKMTNGDDVTDVSCTAQVNVQPETPSTPITPGTPELPNTGAGSALAGLIGTGALGMSVRAWLTSRRAIRSSLLTKSPSSLY